MIVVAFMLLNTILVRNPISIDIAGLTALVVSATGLVVC